MAGKKSGKAKNARHLHKQFFSRQNEIAGRLSIQRGGMGFVTPLQKKSSSGPQTSKSNHSIQDVYIHKNHLAGALSGDMVRVEIFSDQKGRSPEGRIIEIIEREIKEIAVRAIHRSESGEWIAKTVDGRIESLFIVDVSALESQKNSEVHPVKKDSVLLVKIQPVEDEDPEIKGRGKQPGRAVGYALIRAFATADLGTDENVTLHERIVKATHGIATEFPLPVLEEAALLPQEPDRDDIVRLIEKGRKDLRNMGFVTIDGADAKDFDDAIYVEETKSGFTLWVAIADVPYYVRPGSFMDDEALQRGNSYYFPSSVEPMLPEALSNGLCSLKPFVPRLAMVAQISFDQTGAPGMSSFYPAVISSKGRLTYEQVENLLVRVEEDVLTDSALLANKSMLLVAQKLARLCIGRRTDAGNLDFSLPEADISVNSKGEVVSIGHREHLFSHRLIEAFMVAANEAVASFLQAASVPFLYRIHPEPSPEKLENLYKSLQATSLGVTSPKEPGAHDLQDILQMVKETSEESLVHRLVLRSMMQAAYSPDAGGHFGLASACYCHFTSPIRRYADLVVHRALGFRLGMEGYADNNWAFDLEAIAASLNVSERRSVEAEREIEKVCAALYLKDKIGQKFSGIISGIAGFGIFVELEGMAAEGMLRLDSLVDDHYIFDSGRQELVGVRTGKIFRLGMRLAVELYEVNISRREITFTLAGLDNAETLTKHRAHKKFYTSGKNAGNKSVSNKTKGSLASDKKASKSGKDKKKVKGLTTSRRKFVDDGF